MPSFRWALVDIETTGVHVTKDAITEIAVYLLTEQGIEATWSRIINPGCAIPDRIQKLTGITQDMVSVASSFADSAAELLDILTGCVFVAHNARFDYGFIKNAFKKVGITFQAPVLCTIKLLKQLYPNQSYYNLAYIAQSLGIELNNQHRAEADTQALYRIIQTMLARHSLEHVVLTAKALYQQSSIPSKLTTDISQFPEAPGVYIFYGDKNELPLYIGKSVTLKQRILSHFSGDYAHPKEFALSLQVARIEIIPTAGELSALLLESELIKNKLPIYNRKLRRKKVIVGFKVLKKKEYLTLSIVRERVDEEEDLNVLGVYGAFRSIVAAKRTLIKLIKSHDLCPKLCGVEQGAGACFSYQLKRCHGACEGEESVAKYNERLLNALGDYQNAVWPYKGAIAIKEYCPVNKITQFSLFHQWRHLGMVAHEHQALQWRDISESCDKAHQTYDAYKILLSYLRHKAQDGQVIELH